jgi:hypothetical protein
MSTSRSREAIGHPTLRKYRARGVFCGSGLGLLIGVLVSGPHFHEWPAVQSFGVVLGGAACGAVVGWLFASAVVGSLGSGAGHTDGPENLGGGEQGGGDVT